MTCRIIGLVRWLVVSSVFSVRSLDTLRKRSTRDERKCIEPWFSDLIQAFPNIVSQHDNTRPNKTVIYGAWAWFAICSGHVCTPYFTLSTLLLRIPPHAIAKTEPVLLVQPCAYMFCVKRDIVQREGYATLTDLAALIRSADQVVVMMAAADVNVLNMVVPPLSAAKLRAALPNLIEEKLLCDVADCVVTSAPNVEGSRSVAVVQRAWLALVVKVLRELGAQHISVSPEQLCLVQQEGRVSAAVSAYEHGSALAMRLSVHEGLGIVQDTPEDILHALRSLVSASAISLYVPSVSLLQYQTLLAQDPRIKVSADNSSRWHVPATALDLTAGMGAQHQAKLNWQPWRWSLALAAALLLVNTLALNIDWLRMNREAATLRASMKQIYLTVYPKESVILDPLLQMRQKIAAAQHDAGVAAPDDFISLAAEFGQVWTDVMAASKTNAAIAGIEYRERSLWIHLKSAIPSAAMRSALAERKLTLDIASDSELTWQIGSAK